MNIPVVLPTVHVEASLDGALRVEIDGTPFEPSGPLTRADLHLLLDQITTDLAAPVRVDIHESDGSSFSDIATPPEAPPETPQPDSPEHPVGTPCPALAGAGFEPGEAVALAYVVSHHTADAAGATAINLPPALLAAARDGLVLVGLTSRTVTHLNAASCQR